MLEFQTNRATWPRFTSPSAHNPGMTLVGKLAPADYAKMVTSLHVESHHSRYTRSLFFRIRNRIDSGSAEGYFGRISFSRGCGTGLRISLGSDFHA